MSQVTEEIKAKAEICYGAEICKERAKGLLKEMELPNGLLPLDNIEECGYVKETGFVWFKRTAKKEFLFESTGKLVSYNVLVSGYIEKKRVKNLNGIKSKEIAIWVTVYEANVSDNKVTFKGPAGLKKSYPLSAFIIREEEEEGEIN